MRPLIKYSLGRIIQYLLVIFVGISVIFIIPRLTSADPVEIAISQARMVGGAQNPEAVEKMREALTDLYGLKGSIFGQYLAFWKRLLQADFGPSLSSFPTPVIVIIRNSLPWTVGLLSISILISWAIGTILGAITEYFTEQRWLKNLGNIFVILFSIPYYLMALILMVLFIYIFPILPVGSGLTIRLTSSFNWSFLIDLLKHGLLPALSLVLVTLGGWFLSMRALASRVVGEDYVVYAEAMGVPRNKILFQYVIRNAVPSQVTGLVLQMGSIFGGTLVTEYVFSYPGLGLLLYNAVFRSDYNLMMGIVILSMIAISTGALLIDLLYPLLDPTTGYR